MKSNSTPRHPRKIKRSIHVGDVFFVTVVLLVLVGALNVFSSTFYMNLREDGTTAFHLFRHIIYIGIGGVLGVMAYRLDYRTIRSLMGLWVGLAVVLLIAVHFGGITVNGARRWIGIGSVTAQPSEWAKIVAILWASSYLTKLNEAHRPIRLWQSLLEAASAFVGGRSKRGWYFLQEWKPLYVPIVLAAIVYLQPDFGTVIFILGLPIFLYVMAGLQMREMVGTSVVASLAFMAAVAVAPYRWERILVSWDPFSHARDLGYQVVQSIIAVGSGGLVGQGFGQGHSKFAYLPEQYTDFAYAVFAQESGFFLAVLIPLAFLVLLYCGWRIASETTDGYGRYIVYGLTFLLVGQGLYNIAMCVGSAFVTGVPLPFISYGGSALVIELIAVGMILGVDRRNRKRQAYEEKRAYIQALHAGVTPRQEWQVPSRR